MISKQFNDELSACMLQMQHFIHQQLSQHRQREKTHITIVLAKSLLAAYTLEQRDQSIASLELFLKGLEATTSEWKIDHKQQAHSVNIAINKHTPPSLWHRFWQKLNDAAAKDLQGQYPSEQPQNNHASIPQAPNRQIPPINQPVNQTPPSTQGTVNVAKGRLARIDNALSVLANELRYFVNLSNQREDGKRVFAITRVEFRPKNQQASQDLEYYLSIHKTSAHWSARLKAQFTLAEDKKDISPYLNLSAVNFVNLGFEEQQEEYRHAQFVSSVDYDISFESDEREYTPPTTHQNSTTNTASLTIDILDARFKQQKRPYQTSIESENFTIGREGDITVEVGERHFCSAKHLSFELKNQQWYVTDISSNGSLHNGQTMNKGQAVLVKSGDAFRLGAKPHENVIDYFEQFPEVKISFVLARKTSNNASNKNTPLRTPLSQQAVVRTELASSPTAKALCYVGLWLNEQWQYHAIYQLPALLGREGGSSNQTRAINIPSQFTQVSGQHLQVNRINQQQLEITVCEHCTNGVFRAKTPQMALAKNQAHVIDFEEELFLAPQGEVKGIKICFKQANDTQTVAEG